MEDRIIRNFLCECDCKVAIRDTIFKYNIPIEDYEEVLNDIKKWIDFILSV